MNCLVLGGGGFLGSHLCEGLLDAGHAVRIFERRGCSTRNVRAVLDRVDWREGDFTDPRDIRLALEDMEAVFHLIGTTLPQTSNEDPIYDVSSNLISTLHLLQACRDRGTYVVFYSSGGTVYGIPQQAPIQEDHPTDPLCSYGIHKLAIEKYLKLFNHLYGLDYAVLRLSNVYGARQNPKSRQGAVGVFLDRALRGEPVEIWGDGAVVRDYIHVSDIVTATLAVLHRRPEVKLFNVGSGMGLTLLDLVREIEKSVGYPVKVQFKPGRALDVPANILSIDRARRILNWSPRVELKQGLDSILLDGVAQRSNEVTFTPLLNVIPSRRRLHQGSKPEGR